MLITKKGIQIMKEKDARSIFRIVIIIDAPEQTEEDMELNAQDYIKMECELDNLYIESITHIDENAETLEDKLRDEPALKNEDAYEKALKELNKAFKKKGIKFE